MTTQQNHELVTVFEEHLHPLCARLVEMLNEHFSHQTERRGCGYTQSTRLLAEYINQPRLDDDFNDLSLFEDYELTAVKHILNNADAYGLTLNSWRNLDKNTQVITFLADESKKGSEFYQALEKEVQFQSKLRTLRQYAKLEESLVLLDLIEDIILPESALDGAWVELKGLEEKPKVGSCPMAENFFLKIAHNSLLRKGVVNLFTSTQSQSHIIALEKLNMGDDHSCINIVPVIMNGVRLPVGSLFSVAYDEENIVVQKPNRNWKGNIVQLDSVTGFWFLRLTTLAISPANRARAFSAHFQQQVQNGLFNPGTTTMQQLQDVVMEQI